MIALKKKNYARSTLASGISDAAVQLTVASGHGGRFPSTGPFRAVVWGASYSTPEDDATREIIEAALNAGDVFDIVRAKEGTSAKAWGAGDQIAHVLTAGTVEEIEGDFSNHIPVRGSARGLLIKNNATNPYYKMAISADEVCLHDSNGKPLKALAVNLTADITAPGANGLDTGSEAASTWYHIWIISDGTTTAALLSTSASSPTMPSGYTYKALVGAVYNDGGSNFRLQHQVGNRCYMQETVVFNNQSGATAWTNVSLVSYVPTTAKTAFGLFGVSGAVSKGAAVASDSSGMAAHYLPPVSTSDAGWSSWQQAAAFEVPMQEAQKLYVKTQDATANYRLAITGFTL